MNSGKQASFSQNDRASPVSRVCLFGLDPFAFVNDDTERFPMTNRRWPRRAAEILSLLSLLVGVTPAVSQDAASTSRLTPAGISNASYRSGQLGLAGFQPESTNEWRFLRVGVGGETAP